MSSLAYHSKKTNGFDDEVMVLFEEGLRITPECISQCRFWVADLNGQIVGCIALTPLDRKTAQIRSFFTDPSFTGQGIGKMLWHDLLIVAQTQGIRRLFARSDHASVQYYERLGFTLQHEVPSRAVPDQMIPYMARDI